jgi:hypothetical protein
MIFSGSRAGAGQKRRCPQQRSVYGAALPPEKHRPAV